MFPEPDLLALLVVIAFLASILHGATGVAGGLVMAAVFSHLIGIKVTVPLVTCVLVISHFSRGILFQKDTDWSVVRRVLLFGSPMIVVGAVVFGYLSPEWVALVFGFTLTASFPVKYWARSRGITTGPKMLAAASMIWGMLAGNVTGPGFFLIPFIQGLGMNRMAFVGTMATITLAMNIIKLTVFGATQLVDLELLTMGVILGLATIPGNYLGKKIIEKITDDSHRIIVDFITVMLILNFFYLAIF